MITLDKLGNYRKGRIWINELPQMDCIFNENIREVFPIGNSVLEEEKTIVLELGFARHCSNYALLSARFIPSQESESLILNIKVTGDRSEIFYAAETVLEDKVHTGIIKEYAQAILETVENQIRVKNWCTSGELTFIMGAHAEIGSSKSIFSLSTKLVLALMMHKSHELVPEKINQIVIDQIGIAT